ncbi:MAG: thioesterase family protein [Ruminococcus sp.]|nr:thioesterase family protein [Ruminococcus sp.]
MKEINCGVCGKAEMTVAEKDFAVNVGSGSLEVFATPVMVMLMEKSACNAVAEYLENDETTVGTEMNIKHVSATPENMQVFAKAEVTAINGREITFSVRAYDECGLIGEGTHRRFLVYGKKFTEKAKSKIK